MGYKNSRPTYRKLQSKQSPLPPRFISMSLKAVIWTSFVLLTTYAVAVLLGWLPVVLFLFCVLPLFTIYMAYRILKDPQPHSGHTFDEKFYEDYDDWRNR